jgi:membrane-associated phospholipid phosphatase
MTPKTLIAAFLLALSFSQAQAATQGNSTITSLGTGTAIALPLIAGGIAVYKKDWNGLAELGVESLLTVGTAYALKQIVHERRPDGSDFKSFPSDTTALAASGSSFLWGRYGWEYGLPAFAATEFVAYSRIQAKDHHWYDTVASSAISAGYSYFIVTRYRPGPHFYSSLSATPNSASFSLAYSF